MQRHIKLMCFVLGFYEALLGLLNPVNEEVRCLDLQFHLEAFEFMMILCSLLTTQFYTFILYRVCIFSFPHLSSLLPFLKTIPKKKAQTSHKKVFQRKTSACRDGTLKNQPNKMGTTPQHIHTIPTSCAILPTMRNKKLFTHSLNEHSTQHCSLHSLPRKRQSISTTFISNKILQHNLNSQHTI